MKNLLTVVILLILFSACSKGKGPCFDNNTGVLVVKNTSSNTAHIYIDNSDKGYFAPGTNWSEQVLAGSHVVSATNWPTKTVTVEQCLTFTLTLK